MGTVKTHAEGGLVNRTCACVGDGVSHSTHAESRHGHQGEVIGFEDHEPERGSRGDNRDPTRVCTGYVTDEHVDTPTRNKAPPSLVVGMRHPVVAHVADRGATGA